MSMTKIISPSGWDWDRPVAQMVKMSGRGLAGDDRRTMLKIAAPQFVDMLDQIKVAKDEVPVHLIALGASEAYGPNRNGDGFKEATCRKHLKTFEKFARWFRNHKNKDPDKSYGYIKAASYNEPMRRVELLIMLNGDKSAADRNGGFVADKELEKLAKGDDIAVSMACRVPFDVCSGCQNKAKTRNEYCTDATCKYGGCRDNLAKVAEDGHVLHVDNPDPTWFDISNVYRPADRIAYGGKADYLNKAASIENFTPGAEMAEVLGISAPISVVLSQNEPSAWSDAVRGQFKLAYGLSTIEKNASYRQHGVDRMAFGQIQPELTSEQLEILGRPGNEKASAALGALADRKVVLPLRDFAKWLGKSASANTAERLLPGVFTRLLESDDLEQKLATNPFAVSEKTASTAQQALARTLEPTHSLAPEAVRERAARSSLRNLPVPKFVTGNEKMAADEPEAKSLAEAYGLYKLAALQRMAATDYTFNLTSRLSVVQNAVSW